jgi:DNA-binding response OmpR family regulator
MHIATLDLDENLLRQLRTRTSLVISEGTGAACPAAPAVVVDVQRNARRHSIAAYLRKQGYRGAIVGVSEDAISVDQEVSFLASGGDRLLPASVSVLLLETILQSVTRSGTVGQEVSGVVSVKRGGISRCAGGRIEIDPMRMRVSLDGNTVEMSPQPFGILAALAARPGIIFSRDTLLNCLSNGDVLDRTIDSYVKKIRQALNRSVPNAGNLIVTTYGVGYKVDP